MLILVDANTMSIDICHGSHGWHTRTKGASERTNRYLMQNEIPHRPICLSPSFDRNCCAFCCDCSSKLTWTKADIDFWVEQPRTRRPHGTPGPSGKLDDAEVAPGTKQSTPCTAELPLLGFLLTREIDHTLEDPPRPCIAAFRVN